MFTGIVEAVGTVAEVASRADVLVARIEIKAGVLAEGLTEGDSVAVDGCCLTAVAVSATGFTCELTPETRRRTAFERRLRVGARVNLERPLRVDGRLDGHIVQGHVDGVGHIESLVRGTASAELTIVPPACLQRYLVEKGSVAVDGVSLTVAGLGTDAFTVALIPYTLDHTTLGWLAPRDEVHIEADVIAKHVERLLEPLRGTTLLTKQL